MTFALNSTSDVPLDLLNVTRDSFVVPTQSALHNRTPSTHAPRILLLYGSLRERSFSRLLSEETARLLQAMGAETCSFNPHGLPLVDSTPDTHAKVQELRQLAMWAEGMVWSSPERQGAMSGLMKTQIDWIPLAEGATRPTQGKTLAVMQVSGGSQSFNAVNQLRLLSRQSVCRIRRSGPDEAIGVLRPRGRRDGRTGEVHAAHARRVAVSGGPLQRAKKKRGGVFKASESALDLTRCHVDDT